MYDKDSHKMVGPLIEKVGSKDECLRLGFLDKNDNETLYVTVSGLGFLLGVAAADLDTLAAAYAAGFRDGCKEALAV